MQSAHAKLAQLQADNRNLVHLLQEKAASEQRHQLDATERRHASRTAYRALTCLVASQRKISPAELSAVLPYIEKAMAVALPAAGIIKATEAASMEVGASVSGSRGRSGHGTAAMVAQERGGCGSKRVLPENSAFLDAAPNANKAQHSHIQSGFKTPTINSNVATLEMLHGSKLDDIVAVSRRT